MATASAIEIVRAREASRQADALEVIAAQLASIEAAQARILELLSKPAESSRTGQRKV